MIFVTPDASTMAKNIRAAPRRIAVGRQSSSPQIAARRVNFLSINPRPVTCSFDDDGPGTQSPRGPRHDNDHVFIKDIQILPTTDEILSIDRPYMPKKNINEPHFLANGPLRHFDTLFRHLRYDSTEAIRDICYHVVQNLASSNSESTTLSEPRQETPSGNRYFEYQDIRLEEINAVEKKGIVIRLSYNCPEFMRGRFIHNCGRLLEGMLCGLICLDEAAELSVVFMEIHQRQSTQSMDRLGGLGRRAAVELSFPASASYDEILTITRLAQGLTMPRMVLVEFPKVLYAGFYWTLRRLQQMQPHDVAFMKHIAPSVNGQALLDTVAATKAGRRPAINCDPPWYSRAMGHAFELDPISSQPASYTTEQAQHATGSFAEFVKQNTSLDDGQVVAFRQNLTREFAFTQGPPGTGKTFLGIALARTLLASRTDRPDKPILVVCMTNHALDSFLSGLRDAGVKKLTRIGSNSKEEWTKTINLREQSQKHRAPLVEGKNDAWRHKQGLFTDLDSWCKGLNAERTTQNISWHAVEKYLENHWPNIHRQFVGASGNRRTEAFTFDYWAAGGDLQNLKELHMELLLRLLDNVTKRNPYFESPVDTKQLLANVAHEAQQRSQAAGQSSLWKMTIDERRTLLRAWGRTIDREHLAEQLAYMHLENIEASNKLWSFMDEKDAATLLDADVIGMTTTASATRWSLLKMLDLETLICEEAGEVLEAHSLCSLLPTLEHAIFIGDPLQLRPEVAEQTMSLETSIGKDYRLDESMFERFMMPADPAASRMPTSQLNVQRRMHPQIADITRLTYPYLLDHVSTSLHPVVSGVERRIFWLDHQIPEADPTNDSKSHINMHEVEMVVGLVRYLLTRNTYSMGDITILTPYNGQLAALVDALQATCAVWLNPKDREALLDDGILPEDCEKRSGHKDTINMSDLLRLATVDNFQGEESAIVIFSSVRSGGRPGFLKTCNRVNVACSRARDGFYIVGNSRTLQQVPVWKQIVDVFVREGNIGPKLRLLCNRHPQHHVDVSQPTDFAQLQECQIICGDCLPCGHKCFQICHDAAAHERIPCRKPCKVQLECGHKCSRMCSEKCGSCQYRVGERVLQCGHQADILCGGKIPKCVVIVGRTTLQCGHQVDGQCFQKEEQLICDQACCASLSCGHICKGVCRECSPSNAHPPCSEICERKMSCGHTCVSHCHGDRGCPPCNQPCLETCEHGPCKNLCKKICDPCVKAYAGQEDIHGVQMICSLGHTISRSEKFEDVFDRMIAKMGRKLENFAYQIARKEQDLQQGLDPFLQSIRPNPLAAKFNKLKLTARGAELQSFIKDVVRYRDEVAEPFEQSMIGLPAFLPGTTAYNLSFHVRFDILEYRARSVLVLDSLKVAQLLKLLEDPSNEVQRQAEVLQAVALQECLNCLNYCEASLARCKAVSPCVQVELLLQEVQFIAMVDIPSTLSDKDRISDLLDKATRLCRQYPQTAGAFLDSVVQFRDYTNTGDPTKIPIVTNTKSRRVEKDWGHHAVGHLTTCPALHPYSSETFPRGCPECGVKVELESDAYERTRAFLKEDEFLQAMNLKLDKKVKESGVDV